MDKDTKVQSDIIIVGGGLVGLTQALSLADTGFDVICLDRDDLETSQNSPHQNRTTAISYASQKILDGVGVWETIQPHGCAIKDIQILDGASPVLLDLKIADDEDAQKTNAFGWVVQNKYLRAALINKVSNHNKITYLLGYGVQDFKYHDNHIDVFLKDKILHTQLVIGADGRQSFTREWMGVGAREWSYNQHAIVAVVTHEKPHNHIAVEHFRSEGPFAILPIQDDEKGCHRSSIVWTEDVHSNQSIANFSYPVFLNALNARFPKFYGTITAFENRMVYPLGLVHAYHYVKPRMALIGDAAHGIHPIAGQGLNLGLRDVAKLTQILSQVKDQKNDIGAITILEKYQAARRPDNTKIAAATDMLNSVFSNNSSAMRGLRKIGLRVMQKMAPAKKIVIAQAMGKKKY